MSSTSDDWGFTEILVGRDLVLVAIGSSSLGVALVLGVDLMDELTALVGGEVPGDPIGKSVSVEAERRPLTGTAGGLRLCVLGGTSLNYTDALAKSLRLVKNDLPPHHLCQESPALCVVLSSLVCPPCRHH